MKAKPYTFQFLIKPITYIIALLSGTYMVLWIEKLKPSDLVPHNGLFIKEVSILPSGSYPLRSISGKISEEETQYAITAWNYFKTNVNPETGLCKSKSTSDKSSLADMTSHLMGLISAYEIKIIDTVTFDTAIKSFLTSVSKLKLNAQSLPYLEYNVKTLEPVISRAWSGLEIGRFYGAYNKIKKDYPGYSPLLKTATKNWVVDNMILKGWINSGIIEKDKYLKVQDGRLGHEEYVAKNLYKAGFDVSEAIDYEDFIKFETVAGQAVGVDTREENGNPFTSFVSPVPYILDGLEHGWDLKSKELSYRVFKSCKERYKLEKRVTAPSEGHVDEGTGAYIYNTVYSAGKAWNCFDEKGRDSELKTVSTKTVFGWYALYNDPYADFLIKEIKDFNEPVNGWYEGKYEDSGRPNRVFSAATNGLVLEAINYKMNGRIIK